MKTILILLLISISIFSASAQSARKKADNPQFKTVQFASNTYSTDGFIDNITVYPNPVIDELKISFNSSQRSLAVVSLFNNLGKQVYRQESEAIPGYNIIAVDIRSRSIEPGVYFVQLVSENQAITRKLIVK